MLTELGRRMDEHSENFNKEMKKYKKVPNRSQRAEECNTWTEKYTRGFNSRLDEAEEKISQLRDKAMELTQSEEIKKKEWKNVKMA